MNSTASEQHEDAERSDEMVLLLDIIKTQLLDEIQELESDIKSDQQTLIRLGIFPHHWLLKSMR